MRKRDPRYWQCFPTCRDLWKHMSTKYAHISLWKRKPSFLSPATLQDFAKGLSGGSYPVLQKIRVVVGRPSSLSGLEEVSVHENKGEGDPCGGEAGEKGHGALRNHSRKIYVRSHLTKLGAEAVKVPEWSLYKKKNSRKVTLTETLVKPPLQGHQELLINKFQKMLLQT